MANTDSGPLTALLVGLVLVAALVIGGILVADRIDGDRDDIEVGGDEGLEVDLPDRRDNR